MGVSAIEARHTLAFSGEGRNHKSAFGNLQVLVPDFAAPTRCASIPFSLSTLSRLSSDFSLLIFFCSFGL